MANGVGFGPHRGLLLDQFGELVCAAWGEPGYHVGSSVTERLWRDVDVRVMLGDEEWARHFGPEYEARIHHPRWRAEMLAWSTLGERITGLPIDFQVERLSEANAKYPDSPRNPIGFGPLGSARHERVSAAAQEPEIVEADWIEKARAFDLAVNGVLTEMQREEWGGFVFDNRWLAAATRIVLLPERKALLD